MGPPAVGPHQHGPVEKLGALDPPVWMGVVVPEKALCSCSLLLSEWVLGSERTTPVSASESSATVAERAGLSFKGSLSSQGLHRLLVLVSG